MPTHAKPAFLPPPKIEWHKPGATGALSHVYDVYACLLWHIKRLVRKTMFSLSVSPFDISFAFLALLQSR